MTTLRQQSAAHRKRILARERAIGEQITAQFQAVMRHLKPAQLALIAAYAAEAQRLADEQAAAADEEDGGEPLPSPPPHVPVSWLQQSGQWQRYERILLPAVVGFALAARLSITDGQRQTVVAGVTDAQALISTALHPLRDALTLRLGTSVEIAPHRPPSAALDALIGRSQAADKPLAALLDNLGAYTAEKTLAALTAALASGSHPTVAARMIANTTEMAYRRALTISRTELITAYRTANVETFRASSDVLDGWIWQAAADACPFCQSMDGTFHTLDEYLDSHPNCRCVPRPHTRAIAEILSRFAA
jgi:F like protein